MKTKDYIIIAVIITIIILIVMFWDYIKAWLQKPAKEQQTSTTAAPQIDNNRLLKKGVTGAEVKKLQQLLGVSADGVFGPITENALLQKKGVTEVTLNQYAQMPDVNDQFAGENTSGDSDPVGFGGWDFQLPEGGLFQSGINWATEWIS